MPRQKGFSGKSLIGAATGPGICSSCRQTSHSPFSATDERRPVAEARRQIEDLLRRVAVDGLRPVLTRLEFPMRSEGAAMNAQSIAGVENATPFALPIAFPGQLNLQLVRAGFEFAPPSFSQATSQKKSISIRSVVNSSGETVFQSPASRRQRERRADELETNTVPDLVSASLLDRERVLEENALRGDHLLDLVGVHGDM